MAPSAPRSSGLSHAAHHGTSVALETAAARAALRGLTELPAGVRLAINFSPQALQDPAVQAMLMPHAPRLIVEMTERTQVTDFAGLRQALAPLRRAGAQLAADDVGTGYANFEHVSQLRPDILKLDRVMVSGLVDDHVCRAFVSAVVGFAEDIGVQVVAEGVETDEELKQLLSLGVACGQGYLLARADSPTRVRRMHLAVDALAGP